MEMAIALCFFFVIVTSIFIAIAVFLPEWVGITGNKAKDVMREQQGDPTPPLEKAGEQVKEDAKDS